MAYLRRVITNYLSSLRAYLREASGFSDFIQVFRVRLALSKIGYIACRRPIVAQLRLKSFGSAPIYVRSHTTDISVLNEIIASGGYDALVRHPVPDARLIVDLGANTGLVDRWFLARYPRARIVAVEPEPGNYATLRSNVADFAVETVPAAIGAWERRLMLHTSSGEHGFTMVGAPPNGAAAIEVPVVTMASILTSGDPIDLLKVDIEGAEEELFADCKAWIGRVEMLLVECHGNYTLSRLTDALGKAGAKFNLLETDLKPEFGFEVGLFRRA
ncbi:FkbM family methyltransferase [Phenylobacterium sp.]|uniref:FkbM family methyltransferase n=1 Tax=Phenylobacterium sp. TaxID=1871053 RepID=UPI002F4221CD